MLGHKGDDSVSPLHRATHDESTGAPADTAVAAPHAGSANNVEQTGLVLQVEESHSSSRSRALTVGNHPGDLNTPSAFNTIQLVDPHHTPSIKGISHMADRMIIRTNTSGAKVVAQ